MSGREHYLSEQFRKRVARRHSSDQLMYWSGVVAIMIAVAAIVILVGSLVIKGWSAFILTEIRLEITFDRETLGLEQGQDGEVEVSKGDYRALIEEALRKRLGPVDGERAESDLKSMITDEASIVLRRMAVDNPEIIGSTRTVWMPANDEVDQIVKGNQPRDVPESNRNVSDRQLQWIDELREADDLALHLNDPFLTGTDSRNPAMAGLFGALIGSFLTLGVTLVVSFPVAVAAAIYLEEFAPENRWTRLIEVNINNLAAVPSIVFGLLGLTVFINYLDMPRSAPIVGGLVLSLMTLPIIIVAARSALKAVPGSVREAAMMMGASRQLTVFRQVLPVALPSMLTGTIIGMAKALGETAPLILIGMIAFVSAVPSGIGSPATVLPAQIYIWFSNPEIGYQERASGAILVLLALMFLFNGAAIFVRAYLQRKQ